MSNVHEGGTMITGEANVRMASMLALRSGLGLEIKTGLTRRGRPTAKIANEITGCKSRNKRTAYVALNKYVTDALGEKFDRPLPPAKS